MSFSLSFHYHVIISPLSSHFHLALIPLALSSHSCSHLALISLDFKFHLRRDSRSHTRFHVISLSSHSHRTFALTLTIILRSSAFRSYLTRALIRATTFTSSTTTTVTPIDVLILVLVLVRVLVLILALIPVPVPVLVLLRVLVLVGQNQKSRVCNCALVRILELVLGKY
jgi:hypothetical protein